ncbi:MAG TPA: hypothetical protein VH744_06525, partial [Terriglobales bacterium]
MALLAKYRHWFVTFGLSGLLAFAIVGMVMTRDMGQAPARSQRSSLIDQRLLQTARNMAALASGWEELRYARQALHLADHEVDLEFAIAFRDAAEQAPPQTPEARRAYERVSKANAAVKSNETQVEALKKKLSASPGDAATQQQLNLLQVQLELAKDDLDDAREDLSRASGGDTRNRLQRLFERHQADEQQIESLAAPSPANRPQAQTEGTNLLVQFAAWNRHRNKRSQLKQARDEAISRAVSLNARHNSLAEKVEAARSAQQILSSEPADAQAAHAPADTSTAIASLQRLSNRQKDLADLDRGKQDFQELADTYYNWMGAVELRERIALHGIVRAALWILIILLLIYEAGRLIDRLFVDVTHDRKRLQTLRVVVRFAVQAAGLLVIVFVILGLPAQMATILGLATAGLTVALKDF